MESLEIRSLHPIEDISPVRTAMRGEDMLSLLKAKEQGMLWELPNKQEYLKLDLQTHIKEKKKYWLHDFQR